MNRTHLLVVGAPRSGTTLFSAMLGSHPEIAILNEDKMGAWRNVLGNKHPGVKLCIPNQVEESPEAATQARERLVPEIREKLAHFADWDQGHAEPWYEPMAVQSIREFMEGAQARVLDIVRSPEQVVRSIQARGGQPLWEALFRWLRAVEVMGWLQADHGDRFQAISFKRLVIAPEETLSACCRWLGLEYSKSMLFPFTPNYGRDRIDRSKAEESDPEFQSRIAEQFPEHWKIYLSFERG